MKFGKINKKTSFRNALLLFMIDIMTGIGKKEKPRQNLFGRIGSWTQKTNQYSKIINMNDKIMKTAAELEEALLVKNEGSLHGSVDKLVSLHKNCADVVKACDAFNANVKTKDPYENSKVQEQVKKKVDEANKKQAEQAAKAKKVKITRRRSKLPRTCMQ